MSSEDRLAGFVTAFAACGFIALALFTVRVRARIVVTGSELHACQRETFDLRRRAQALSVAFERSWRTLDGANVPAGRADPWGDAQEGGTAWQRPAPMQLAARTIPPVLERAAPRAAARSTLPGPAAPRTERPVALAILPAMAGGMVGARTP